MSNPRHWIQTYSTRAFHFDDPISSDLHIEDIARSLSRTPRFAGHTSKALTVAEHSVAVSCIAKELGADELTQLHALMHDAHEAFTGDIPSPFKRYLEEIHGFCLSEVQAVIQNNLLDILDIPLLDAIEKAELIEKADLYALKIERDLYMESSLDWGDTDTIKYARDWLAFYGDKPMSGADAMRDFKARFKLLWRPIRDA